MARGQSARSETSETSRVSEVNVFEDGAAPARQHPGDDEAQNSVLQKSPFQTAVFGVLYSVQKQRLDARPAVAVLYLVLDYLQLLLLVLQPSFGFHIDTDQWIWKVVNWAANFGQRLASSQTYTVYTGCLLLAVVVLLLALVLCCWVAFAFNSSRLLKITWPLSLLRVVLQLVVQTYFMATLELFLVAADCRWVGHLTGTDRHGYVSAYPHQRCLSSPHLLYLILALAFSALLVALAVGVAVGEPERNPGSRRLLAMAQAGTQMRAVGAKGLLVIVALTLGTYRRPQAVVLAFLATYIFYAFLMAAPHLNQWVNHTRVALYASAALPSLLLLPMRFAHGAGVPSQLSTVMWSLVVPAMPLGFLLSWLRSWWQLRTIREAIRCAPVELDALLVYEFADPEEVEFASRVLRRWVADDMSVLDAEAVQEAAAIIKVGMALFPANPTMTLLSSNFLIHATDGYHAGYSQAMAAKKQGPNLMERFTIFVRELDHRAAAGGDGRGMGGMMDLVAYVEFQRNLRIVTRCHKASLLAVRSFWKLLQHSTVSFRQLASAVNTITSERNMADQTYNSVLERYPMSAILVRSYARFLDDVHNDPWTAARLFKQAEKLDLESQENGMTQLDEQLGKGVTARNSAVVVVSAAGVIQLVNKVAADLFGWRKGELEGNNFAVLAPLPYNLAAHTKTLHALSAGRSTSTAEKASSTAEVAGMHSSRYMFPMTLTLSQSSGSGEDTSLMIVVKALAQERGVVTVWTLLDGTIASVGANFADTLGSEPERWLAHNVAELAVEHVTMQALVEAAALSSELSEADPGYRLSRGSALGSVPPDGDPTTVNAATKSVVAFSPGMMISHHFCHPLKMDVSVTLGGSDTAPILVFSLRHVTLADHLCMVADHLGRVVYITTALASVLGHSTQALLAGRTTLDSLMPQPWAQLHAAQWVRVTAAGGTAAQVSAALGAGGVVQLLTSSQKVLPVALSVSPREQDGSMSYVVDITPSTLENTLDQQRLRIQVDNDGIVRAAGHSPVTLFGFDPSTLVGRPLADFVDVLRFATAAPPVVGTPRSAAALVTPRSAATLSKTLDGDGTMYQQNAATGAERGRQAAPLSQVSMMMADLLDLAFKDSAGTEEHDDVAAALGSGAAALDGAPHQRFNLPQLLSLMVLASSNQPGSSWRVGVHAPISDEDIRQMNALSSTLFLKKTRAAVLQVVLHTTEDDPPPGSTDHTTMTLDLWAADMVCGVVEVDAAAVVLRTTNPLLHPAELLLGMASHSLLQQPVSRLFNVSADVLVSLDDGRRGGMKVNQAGAGRVGPLRQVVARHADQRDVHLTSQAVVKMGASRTVFLVLRLAQPSRGDAVAFLKQLCAGLSGAAHARTPLLGNEAHLPSLRTSPTSSAACLTLGSQGALPVPSIMPSGGPAFKLPAQPASLSSSAVSRVGMGPQAQSSPLQSTDEGRSKLSMFATPELVLGPEELEDGCGVSDDEDDERDNASCNDDTLIHRVSEWVPGTDQEETLQPQEFPALQFNTTQQGAKRRSLPHSGHEGQGKGHGSPVPPLLSLRSASSAPRSGAGQIHAPAAASEASSGGGDSDGGGLYAAAKDAHNNADSADGADCLHEVDEESYRNAKRFRKLAKVVGFGRANSDALRYRMHGTALWVILCVGVLVVYILMAKLVDEQGAVFDVIDAMGDALRVPGEFTAVARVLDNLQQLPAAGTNPLYNTGELSAFRDDLKLNIAHLSRVQYELYLSAPVTTAYNLSAQWNVPTHNVTTMYNTVPTSMHVAPMSAWALGNLYTANAREVYQHNDKWVAAGVPVGYHPEFIFLTLNLNTLFFSYLVIMISYASLVLDTCASINSLQDLLFHAYGLGVCLLCTAYALWLLWRVADQRYRLFSVFLTVPQGFIRTLAAKEVHLDGDSEEGSVVDGSAATRPPTAGGRGDSGYGEVTVSGVVDDKSAAAAEPAETWRQMLRQTWRRLQMDLMLWRPLRVPGGKRGMMRNSWAPVVLLLPFILWLVIMVSMFQLDLNFLHDMRQPAAMQVFINVVPGHLNQAVYFAHEACSTRDATAISGNLQGLQFSIMELESLWQTMLSGAPSPPRQGDPSDPNGLVGLIYKGLPLYSAAISSILYTTGVCLLHDQSQCATPDTQFYEITHAGLDAMVTRFIVEAKLLLADNITAVNLENSRLRYIWQVGRADVATGMNILTDAVRDVARQPLAVSNKFTLVGLVFCFFLAAAYTIGAIPVFLHRVSREGRRVAQLLSQLPKDAGAEEAVQRMLGLRPTTPAAAVSAKAVKGEEVRPLLVARGSLELTSSSGDNVMSGRMVRSSFEAEPYVSSMVARKTSKQSWLRGGGKAALTRDEYV